MYALKLKKMERLDMNFRDSVWIDNNIQALEEERKVLITQLQTNASVEQLKRLAHICESIGYLSALKKNKQGVKASND